MSERVNFTLKYGVLPDGRRFRDVNERWQLDFLRAMEEKSNFYGTTPRGHAKTWKLGTVSAGDLVLEKTRQEIFNVAVDFEQAGLLHEDIARTFQDNPELRDLVTITKNEIRLLHHPRSRAVTLASDAPSAYGRRPTRLNIDEFAQWTREDMWYATYTGLGKSPDPRCRIITTPTWTRDCLARRVLDHAKTDPAWTVIELGPVAGWIPQDFLAAQKRILPHHVYETQHEGRWSDAGGAWFPRETIKVIFVDTLPEGAGPEAIGLDVAISRDATGIVKVRRVDGFIVVDHITTFEPRRGQQIDLEEVEEEVEALAKRYRCPVVFDPYQAVHLAQRLTRRGVQMVEYAFTSEKRKALFANLADVISRGVLRSRPNATLERELLGMEVKQMSSGMWRIDHRRQSRDDVVVSLGLAIQGLPPEITGEPGIWADGTRIAATGYDEDILTSWTERGTRGVPGHTNWGDW